MTDVINRHVSARPDRGAEPRRADLYRGARAALMPNLFIIGASKTGTSALHAYLGLHPEIRMSDEKEPCFFVDHDDLMGFWPVMAHRPFSWSWEDYLDLFAGGESARFRGESSTLYSQHPFLGGVPARIAAAAPGARLIYLVREPVQRTIGDYWQAAKEFQERLPLDRAIRENPIYREASDYAMQLEQYLAFFDRSRILVVVSERLRSRRQETLARIFSWLGVAPMALSADQLPDRHVSPPTSRRERLPGARRIRDSALWARAREILPQSLVSVLRSAATAEASKQAHDEAALRAELGEQFAPRIARFEALIGESIPEWRPGFASSTREG